MRFLEKRTKKLSEFFNSIIEKPLLTSSLVLVAVTILVLALSMQYYIRDFDTFIQQVLAEAHGMIFDIAVIGILIFWLNQNGEIRQRIRTYKDEIDDFRLWESEEAAFRTVGNIKRLNRHKIHEINLVNCYLPRTNLNYVNLSSSNMNSANISQSSLIESNLENARLNQTNFENSNLNQAILKGAYASGANFKDAFLIKAHFENAFLIKANFNNAFLMEADLKGCYVMGADFENASLYKADLRGAKGLTLDQLAKAKTLYLAKFDDDILEQIKINLPQLVGA
ncbi:pentapeptide repeat-containing protein [Parachryseolinea silvisoli]|uniref:pentapeptide repeat-containing protein n=1 Tax=Parachryseolinea silvisoli TaxID=2873601 RepID=UPI002265AD7F|nr:pentapeptide repeat-containing protein [Parachryseolinea silvisoli]MCD9014484.1 pentapeptide repeat-containing protein [Parachryseolinea silvisoli]